MYCPQKKTGIKNNNKKKIFADCRGTAVGKDLLFADCLTWQSGKSFFADCLSLAVGKEGRPLPTANGGQSAKPTARNSVPSDHFCRRSVFADCLLQSAKTSLPTASLCRLPWRGFADCQALCRLPEKNSRQRAPLPTAWRKAVGKETGSRQSLIFL